MTFPLYLASLVIAGLIVLLYILHPMALAAVVSALFAYGVWKWTEGI